MKPVQAKAPCCGPCGDAQCRTVTVGEVTYEAIPRELIVKAGMLAAAEILGEPQGCGCEKETDKPRGAADPDSPPSQEPTL